MTTFLFVAALGAIIVLGAMHEIRAERRRLRAAGVVLGGSDSDDPKTNARRLGLYVLLLWPFVSFLYVGTMMVVGDSGAWQGLPWYANVLSVLATPLGCLTSLTFYLWPAFAVVVIALGQAPRWLALALPITLACPPAAVLLVLVPPAISVIGTAHPQRQLIIETAVWLGSGALLFLLTALACLRFAMRKWPAAALQTPHAA